MWGVTVSKPRGRSYTSSGGSGSRGSYAGGGVTYSRGSYNHVGAYAAVAMMSSGSRRRYGTYNEPWLVFAGFPSEKPAALETLEALNPTQEPGC